ncbi:MAG: HlyD family type I secretion periplasmic adaptor subunit [Caulobacteraceae bacterium]
MNGKAQSGTTRPGWLARLVRSAGRDEREFLPAALEVIETPPSPTGRALGLVIILFFAVALAWAIFGKVDVIATAPGRVMPAGDVKTIQPLEPGTVRAIRVQDGDHVRAGQLLIELDPTQAGADLDRLSHDLMQDRLDVARLLALKVALETGGSPRFDPPPDAAPELVEEARTAMRAQADQQAAKLADLSQQISQKDAEIAEAEAEAEKTKASVPLLAQKAAIYEKLSQEGYGSSVALIDAQQQLSEARHDLLVLSERGDEASAGRAALERQRDEARSEYAASVLDDLRKAQAQENDASQDWVKAQNRSAQTELKSPIDGVVDQLAVHTLHGVVTSAESLMIVVPDSRNLMVEARLANRDVGFVHVGQPVKIKVETFNFTRYGMLDGRVIDVSKDVISPDAHQPAQPATAPAPDQGAAPAPTYVARIRLAATRMLVEGREASLLPGMSVTAEIKTGERTILDYLLSPLARKTQESLHER